MALYNGFAPIYQRGPYLRFSQLLAESVFPEYLAEMGIEARYLLDIACGEGSFAVAMSKMGYQVTGIDQSHQMIDLAQERARADNAPVNFQIEDMRSFSFDKSFDLVTCFFDSLNYMLIIKDLQDVFENTYQGLRPGGYFIFDMNTIYGLAVNWMQEKTYIHNEADDFIEIHQQSYDYENQIATMLITIFVQRKRLWKRIEETHRERGYPIADIQFLLNETGFEIAGMYGSLKKRSEVQITSPRVWFTVRKPPSDV
ncbi:MAG: class I SAM-dependent methyltransferase [Chloroflexota bacterium]|nr:class I SAM-dependent methyltransferase [Chloroflexota bacterium]